MRRWGVVSGHPCAVARCSSPGRSWPPSPVALLRRGPSESAAWHVVRTLLADGTGPLYQSAAPGGLHHELDHVLAALDSFG